MAINGDAQLTKVERVIYGVRALREMLGAAFTMAPMMEFVVSPVTVNLMADGASPLRILSTQWVVMNTHVALTLDVCAGNGFLGRYIRSRVIGVDASRRPTVVGDVQALPFADKSFDAVISHSGLEHVRDDGAAAREMRRCLKPLGLSVHAVPSAWSYVLYGPHGWRRYTARSLRRLFEREGFHVVAVQSLGGLATFLLHLVLITLPARVGLARSSGLYKRLLLRALKLDEWFPWFPAGYGVVAWR